MTRAARFTATVLLALTLASCGQAHDDAVRSAASAFYDAYAAGDGVGACARLAPRTRNELEKSEGSPCESAVLKEALPTVADAVAVHVFGTQAEVTWAGETTFLSRFPDGWKVVAADCKPRRGHPYDCMISGG
jgi:hypothetical protein